MEHACLFETFAAIFEYPTPDLARRARECASLFPGENPQSDLMDSFASYSASHSLGHLQEVYTRTFDLQPSCFPYIGYQLFGESYKRGDFLARLKGRCTECGLELGTELPDHLAIVLRFLARIGDGEEARDLVSLCLVPALEKMVGSVASEKNPYLWALQALSESIGPRPRGATTTKEV